MNSQKLTKRSLEAINDAQSTAIDYQNMNVEQEHLFFALMAQENGIIPQLFTKMGIDAASLEASAEKLIAAAEKQTLSISLRTLTNVSTRLRTLPKT